VLSRCHSVPVNGIVEKWTSAARDCLGKPVSTFDMATILRTGSDGLTRVITRSSLTERESLLVEATQAALQMCELRLPFGLEFIGSLPS